MSNDSRNREQPVSVIDLVCGMTIDKAQAPFASTFRGHAYYFCSASCKAKFDSDPARYDYSGNVET
jgi:Cu+-exporting ATPase